MALNPTEITERIRLAGEDWSDLDAAASLLEETKKTVLAELMNKEENAGMSVAARESLAMASKEYKTHLASMVEARRLANRARVKYDSARTWTDLVRTAEATARQEMKG